ncbi:BTAD domain-containing putative transcriptional regulator [Couchioplanes azureus]|uniref:BTAD domain-containing putative transcriptional regulator n=1 Tax=Couchioplanes caeruleus TaxID=56438 RepID=UPI00166FC201|nr:BTAD domain-containing putative transcriptional regulator [Couchioplanes caeruleus]GGQ68925.1 SARP family transcriptional regulator [Couchioplanes caeruleus subsp. azureus]
MRITTLGPLAVDGQPVRGERLAAVVRELVGAPGRTVSVGALVDAVWHGDPPEDSAGAVQALISRARRLGLAVAAVPGGYRVPADEVEIDAVAARALAGRARAALRAGDLELARREADAARALFPAVPELGDAEAARLFGEVVAVGAEAALAGCGSGGHDADLRLLVARTPPDEPAAALLVRVLAAQGRDAEALEVVERLRAELADRYGADPSPVIADVHLALLRGELKPPGAPRRPARTVMPASWRRPGTTLVGRDSDVAAVLRSLAEVPLVTVVAAGGAGKTRLAAEVARRAPGAVRVVELAGVRAPEEVLPVVLAALGGAETATPTSALSGERRVLTPEERLRAVVPELDGLVVLDNCEHLLDAAAAVVADLLAAASPELAVLATSRAPLGLAGELVHRLPALPDAEAIDLLETRARAGGAAVTWDAERAVALCHRLDNLPLALELAAARLRHMPIDDVLAGLADRFALLDDALRGLPERHASLWAMVDWSRELLAPDDRELLQRLAVIPAPFTAEAAAAVAEVPDVRRGLAALVEQSLLTLDDGDGGPPRYRMLETVREYGEARLGDRTPAMTGLVSWARRRAVALGADHIGPRQLDALAETAREQENLVAALRWSLAQGDEPAVVDVAHALFQLWTIRDLHLEVSAWSRMVLHAEDPAARRVSALFSGRASGKPLPDADRLARLCLLARINGSITGPPRLMVLAGRALRVLARERPAEISPRNAALADALPEFAWFVPERTMRSAELLVAHPDPYVRALGLFARAVLRESGGMPEDSIVDAEAAYALFETVGDHWGMAISAQAVGHAFGAGRGTAVEWLARSVRHMELVGAAQDARSARVLLDARKALEGDAEAEVRLRVMAASPQADRGDVAQACLGLAHLAWERGDFADVLACADAVVEACAEFGEPIAQHRGVFRVAAAVLHLMAAAEQPAGNAEARGVTLLTVVREDALRAGDTSLAGAWALGGAVLAAHRGDEDLARRLWARAMRAGASMSMMLPPGRSGRLTEALGTEDLRRTLLSAHRDEPVATTVAEIRELMDRLLTPSSGTPGAPAA